jgi:soluble lytic murein transglycosylase
MKTKRCWDPIIRARLYSSLLILLAIAGAALPGYGQTDRDAALQRLAASYRKSPNAKDRAALLHYAAANNRTEHGALARLAIARGDIAQGRADEALKLLDNAAPHLPALSDYILYLRGLAHARAGDPKAAGDAHLEVLQRYPSSPLRTDAAIGVAKARLEEKRPDDAILALKMPQVKERQPEFGFLLGKAYLARNDHALAATHLQQVYTKYPVRSEARDAQVLLTEIRQRLGEAYPPATAQDLMQRADALRKARQYAAARSAVEALLADLGGDDKELAQVTIAAIDYDRLQTSAAQSALQAMSPKSAEANAQRLYYLLQCARRLKQPDAMLRHAAELRKLYPESPWTMDAHRWAGNYFLLDNEVSTYVPLFEACAEAQPRDPESAYCHWKVAWSAYLKRDPKAHPLMAAHLERYPYSDKYVAALLFLGRLAERDQRLAAARSYYEEVVTVEPLSYYAELAATSLQGRNLQGISRDQELGEILAGFRGRPLRESFRDLKPDPETRRTLERSSLLARVEFTDWAELELRTAPADGGQRQLLAVELAGSYADRGDHFRALRSMKSMAPGYFRLQTDYAPEKFWHLLFPMPYGKSLRKYSLERELDPGLVAGLIRQESEFKPDAVSRAKAYGLMQVLPSTGRSLARTLGLGPFSVGMLTRPDVNLNMGTYYLSRLGNGFDGRLEYALASYNAGKSRADRWKTWGEFREPIEFIETIPFSETREYVLSVFRNAMVYRAVYPELSESAPQLRTASTNAPAKPATAAKAAPAKSSAAKPAATAKPAAAKAKPAAAKAKPAARKPAATKAKTTTQARQP